MIESILLAEDNVMNHILVLHGLRQFKVDIAFNGKEAVDLFNVNDYDVVLMDIQMPLINGIEATRKIREIESKKLKKPGAIILGMTAGCGPNIIEACEAAGMNDFLPKPFNPYKLPQIIRDMYSKYVPALTRESEISLPEG